LNAEVVWSAESVTLKAVSFDALGGRFVASGSFGVADDSQFPLDLGVRATNVDVNELAAYANLTARYSWEGRLSMNAQFHGKGRNWNELRQNLAGKGSAELSSGVIKNFNLAGAVLSDVNGLPGLVNLSAAGSAPANKIIMTKRDTIFDKLDASFAVEKGRISSRDLTWITHDYTVLGEGWIDFDRSTRWNATLVMSPTFSQAIAQEHANARFLLDRNGRLVVPFRVDGRVWRPQIKPDVRRLAENIQRGLLGRDSTPRRSAVEEQQKRKRK
jgi:uncharacterized protein involved in outer membrane biogenesis